MRADEAGPGGSAYFVLFGLCAIYVLNFVDRYILSLLMVPIQDELGETGRVLIRYSGTENKARVMVEGRDESRVHEIANQLASKLKASLAGVD